MRLYNKIDPDVANLQKMTHDSCLDRMKIQTADSSTAELSKEVYASQLIQKKSDKKSYDKF